MKNPIRKEEHFEHEPEGNHYDNMAHCYDELNNEDSNAGTTKSKGLHYADQDGVSYSGSGKKGMDEEHEEMEVSASKASRGKAGAKETY